MWKYVRCCRSRDNSECIQIHVFILYSFDLKVEFRKQYTMRRLQRMIWIWIELFLIGSTFRPTLQAGEFRTKCGYEGICMKYTMKLWSQLYRIEWSDLVGYNRVDVIELTVNNEPKLQSIWFSLTTICIGLIGAYIHCGHFDKFLCVNQDCSFKTSLCILKRKRNLPLVWNVITL